MGTAKRQSRQKRGPKGAGRITLQKSGSAKVYLHIKTGKDIFNDVVVDIAQEDVPEKIGNWKFAAIGTPTKPVFIELNSDETKVFSVRPFSGNFFVKFSRIAGRENQPPSIFPIEERRPEGQKFTVPAHLEFWSILEIVGHPEFTGMEIPVRLWYLFGVDKEQEEVYLETNKAKSYYNLEKFLEVAGYEMDTDTLTPGEPGEILTQLNGILKSRDTTFQCQLRDGYVPFKVSEALSLAPEGSV